MVKLEVPSIGKNISQLRNQEKQLREQYWEFKKETIDTCKEVMINPYTTAESLILLCNSTANNIENELDIFIQDRSIHSNITTSNKAIYQIFLEIKPHINDRRIQKLIAQYFEVDEYKTHVSVYIKDLLENKKR